MSLQSITTPPLLFFDGPTQTLILRTIMLLCYVYVCTDCPKLEEIGSKFKENRYFAFDAPSILKKNILKIIVALVQPQAFLRGSNPMKYIHWSADFIFFSTKFS